MLTAAIACVLLITAATLIHYEVLNALSVRLPALAIPGRSKLLVVMFATFAAHALEIGVYGCTMYSLINYLDAGSLQGSVAGSLLTCLYFSAETYTSLGFGDLTPTGPVRLLAGLEALNGLLLIGWSASYSYLAMERFWQPLPHESGT